MRTPHDRRRGTARIAVAGGLGVVLLTATASACSTNTGAGSSTSSSPVTQRATIMVDGHTHPITAAVDCTTSAAQPSATPAESGNQTTRISTHDDSSSLSLSLSDDTPPGVNAFALSLKVADGQYQLPFQPVQSSSQVEATKDGKSYTVTGSGQAMTPGQADMRQVQFGIHVTCP